MRAFYLIAITSVLATACEGPAGPAGEDGQPGGTGDQGEPGDPGPQGDPGDDGDTPLAPWLTAPGLEVEVMSAEIEGGAASVTFRLTDPNGVPVDRTGLLTQGTVSASFALAWLDEEDGDPLQYTSYITRVQTVGDVSATQATTESTGTFEVVDRADGIYRYTFAAAITPMAGRTHTVGISASRTIDGETVRTSAVLNFMPDGGAVATTRQVVTDSQCNSCHGEIEGHGGRYTTTAMCVMCHSPQTTDPNTGNTVDFPVMIHRIHRGAELPSVDLGDIPYQIVGGGQNNTTHDFSKVEFPQLIQRCDACHGGATQGNYWMNRPSPTDCRSCHDDLVFAPATPAAWQFQHIGNVPVTAPCATCHTPSGSTISIADVHDDPFFNPEHRVAIDVRGVTNSGPGQQPIIEFRVTVDDAPRDILTSPMNNLAAVVAGPNTDYARYLSYSIQPTPSTNPGTITAVDAADGVFTFQPAAALALPADAAGSWTVAMTGYLTGASEERFAAVADLLPFAVTGEVVTPRRTVVDTANCNRCHYDVNGHGGSRKGAQFCALCHNPNNANDERSPREEGEDVFVETVDLKVMIHKIHAGEHLENGYVLGGFPAPSTGNPVGTPAIFSEVGFPRPLNNCDACHDGDSFTLPLADGVLPSRYEERTCNEDPDADTNELCGASPYNPTDPLWPATVTLVPPQTAVCTSCHDSLSVLIHAEVNASNGQEACATCHDTDSVEDVASVHGF